MEITVQTTILPRFGPRRQTPPPIHKSFCSKPSFGHQTKTWEITATLATVKENNERDRSDHPYLSVVMHASWPPTRYPGVAGASELHLSTLRHFSSSPVLHEPLSCLVAAADVACESGEKEGIRISVRLVLFCRELPVRSKLWIATASIPEFQDQTCVLNV